MGRYNNVSARGTLIGHDGGQVFLAHIVLLSMPPQVGRGIEVRGLDPACFDQAQRRGPVWWQNDVVVIGSVEDGLLDAEVVMVEGTQVWRSDRTDEA